MLRSFFPSTLLLALLVQSAPAQLLQVRLADSEGNPLPAVLVSALGADGAVQRVTLSGARGQFTIPAGLAGPLTLRVERPGYLPFTSPLSPPADASVPVAITVTAERRPLADVRGSSGSCTAGGVSGAAAELWEQASLALRIMALAEESGLLDVRGGRYIRMLDRSGRVQQGIIEQEAFAGEAVPHPGLRLALLPVEGFAFKDGAGQLAYLLPAPAMLLSPVFLETHCVHRVVVERSRRGEVGLGFRPVERSATPGVEGVLWLERSSGQVRSVEFEYRDPSNALPRGARGLLAFGAGREGLPQLVRWWVRMPHVFTRTYTGGATERTTNVVESGAFVLAESGRPLSDPDGVFAMLGQVFALDPILVEGERAQDVAVTEEGTKLIQSIEVQGMLAAHGWDIVRNLRPNRIRRSEYVGFQTGASGLAFVVYQDRMRLSCLLNQELKPAAQSPSAFNRPTPGLNAAGKTETCMTPQGGARVRQRRRHRIHRVRPAHRGGRDLRPGAWLRRGGDPHAAEVGSWPPGIHL